ncbi:MAG: esterase YqiA [Candidatus Pelagadaptatus aseana]|uniref:YqiA/YcfP family alpha/beta fold hydrolase n=1 Tax=Candidatus Pelagadaptatus aseana TaxID=3120508 RepID=UPI0039B28477
MQHLVYVHGFLSAPGSHKAQLTQQWLARYHPQIQYHCPHLSPYPQQAQQQLKDLMADLEGQQVGLVGSSLGGFWSTWLIEHYSGMNAVLINPSVRPFEFVSELVGETLNNYYTDDTYQMQPEHAGQLREAYPSELVDKSRYWVLVQTGDETLDYRQAVERYDGCHVTIEQGGDHGFQDYDRHLPDIIDFLFR